MQRQEPLCHLVRLALVAALVSVSATNCPAAKTTTSRDKSHKSKQEETFPSFETVTKTVGEHLAASRGYKEGDLLTVSSVEPLFGKLDKLNWKVEDRKLIIKSILPDTDGLARQLATRNGKRFMRQIAELPNGYDRIDRFRKMPYGERRLSDMIRSPDGYKMIEYMTTTPNGKNMGRMVSRGVNGEDFNKPTGRIYTELDLLKRLKKSYDAEAVRRLTVEPVPAGKAIDGAGAEPLPARPMTPAAPAAGPKTKAASPKSPAESDPFE